MVLFLILRGKSYLLLRSAFVSVFEEKTSELWLEASLFDALPIFSGQMLEFALFLETWSPDLLLLEASLFEALQRISGQMLEFALFLEIWSPDVLVHITYLPLAESISQITFSTDSGANLFLH